MRWFIAVLFSILAAISGYLTWLLWRDEADAKWIFGAITAFMLIPVLASLRPAPGKVEDVPTRFVPHRTMQFFAALILVGIIAAIIATFLG